MDCSNVRPLLEAYLDDELARAEAREVEAHVDGCAECRAALSRLDDLRRTLRETPLRHAAPAALRERVTAAIQHAGNADASAARSTRFQRGARRASWLRIAAACVLAFGAGALTMRQWPAASGDDTASVAHDLFASHWRALAATSPVDVVSSDRHTVKPWFAGKVAQAPLVRDFAQQGFALVGGRIDYAGGQRVPVLVYRHGEHLIDVFVLPSSPGLGAEQQRGYSLDPITLGGQRAAVVSDMDRTELGKLEQLLVSPVD